MEGIDTSLYLKIFVGLLAMVPAPIVVPLFLGVVAGRSAADKRGAAFVGAVAFAITAIAFTWVGLTILHAFGITIGAFRMAGGFLLLIIALEVMRSDTFDESQDEGRDGSAFALGVVPIAIPILAGPGAISTIVIFASETDTAQHLLLMSGVIVLVAIYVFFLFWIAALSDRLFTRNVSLVINKVMGLLLLAIAFEFMMDGLAAHFPELITIHE